MTTRPTQKERGYGWKHEKLRKVWQRQIDEQHGPTVLCARCLRPILPGQEWDLGHDDYDRSRYTGPEHRRCNRATSRHRAERQNGTADRARGELSPEQRYARGLTSRVW
jgi:hypothetical protein